MSQNSAVQTQVKSIFRLYQKIADRWEYPLAKAEKASIADEDMVITVGQINLLASDDDRIVFQETLWPKVRRSLAIRSPGRFTHHCYDELVASTLELANCPQPPQAHDILSILGRRYDTGCLLEGLVALWTDQGVDAARFLWHQQGIVKWDEAIRQLIARLDITSIIRDWSVTVLGLSSCSWFGALRDITLRFVQRSAPADASTGLVASCPLRLRLLTEMMVEQYQDEFPALREYEICTDDNSERPTVVWLNNNKGDFIGVWCPVNADEVLELTPDDRDYVSALILSEEVDFTIDDSDIDDDVEYWPPIELCPELVLTGYLSNTALPVVAGGETLQLSSREFPQFSIREMLKRIP